MKRLRILGYYYDFKKDKTEITQEGFVKEKQFKLEWDIEEEKRQ